MVVCSEELLKFSQDDKEDAILKPHRYRSFKNRLERIALLFTDNCFLIFDGGYIYLDIEFVSASEFRLHLHQEARAF
uniref:Uncharacterized protein n=1 Tax=Onchocerca volvulus TaxID=6282 RepID=A0A8R1TYA8_ONCVO